MIEKIQGRTFERIATPVGSMLSSAIVLKIIEKIEGIKDFQVVQKSRDSIILYLISDGNKITDEEKDFIKKEINDYLSYELIIDFDYIDKLPKLANGKVIRVVSLKE